MIATRTRRYTDISLEEDLSAIFDIIPPEDQEGWRAKLIRLHDSIVAGFNEAAGRVDGSEHDPRAVLDECMRTIEQQRKDLAELAAKLHEATAKKKKP